MSITFFAAAIIYLAVLLAAGLRLTKRHEGMESFFLASRRLGAPRVAFSLCASWIGATSLLVSTDQACREGLSALWIIGIPAVVTLILFLPMARAIRLLKGMTISDIIEERYGSAARMVTTILLVWYMMVLAASQMVAAGTFLKTFLGTSYLVSLAVAAAVVLLYAGAGGFVSVVRTQSFQFFLLMSGIAAMVASLWIRSPLSAVRDAARSLGKARYFDFFAQADRNILIALSFILAWTISPIAWQRIQAAKGDRSARLGLGGAAFFLGFFYTGIVVAGLLFLPIFPELDRPGPVISAYILGRAGTVIGSLLFVTVMAAIMSTMVAAVNAGAFSLTRDLQRYTGMADETRSVAWGRAATLVIGAGALLVATRFQDILKTLGLASKIMAEGLFIPGLAAMVMKKKAPRAGLFSLIAGGGFALLCFVNEAGLLALPVPAWPRSLLHGLALSGLGFALGLLYDRLKPQRGTVPPGGDCPLQA